IERLPQLSERFPYSVALTFDDGPYPFYTEKLIKLLENERAKATFFVIGRHATRHPELIKLIASKGHELGGHTYNHRNIMNLSREELIVELENTRKAIEDASGIVTYLFRPPGGKYSKTLLNFLSRYGYTTVLWNILPKDHEMYTTKEDIINRIVKNAKSGDIILLHLGRKYTLDALPEIIWRLRLKGFKFVTVSELMNETRYAENICSKDHSH
ncbi:MAG: polysaccharide deacetylase family protein, partial [Elusimicrobiota bacterium]|nr:polysaccharide deacetylase family protein [Elusimicrobiota bacterium]